MSGALYSLGEALLTQSLKEDSTNVYIDEIWLKWTQRVAMINTWNSRVGAEDVMRVWALEVADVSLNPSSAGLLAEWHGASSLPPSCGVECKHFGLGASWIYLQVPKSFQITVDPWTMQELGALTLHAVGNSSITCSQSALCIPVPPYLWFCNREFNYPRIM